MRSIAQGALAVDFALYLHSLNWTGLAIGGLLTGIGIFNSVISIIAGPLSDRKGRKPLLLGYQSATIIVSILMIFVAQPGWLVGASLIGGFGRGANGAAGPFSPIEQSWLAKEINPDQRAAVYSLNSTIGFFGMAIGAILAAVPALLRNTLPGALAYRPLFALALLAAIGGFVAIYGAQDEKPVLISPDIRKENPSLEPHEKEALWKLSWMNALNSTAIGLTGPLISYWFLLKFGVGPGVLGPMQAITFVLTGFSATINGQIASKIGLVKSVVYSRGIGLVLLIMLPLMPIYWYAAIVYVLRSIFNRGTVGTRQALIPDLVNNKNHGLAFSVSAASAQFPQALGPILAGPLIANGWFETPFFIGAFFQALYVGAYGPVFKKYDRFVKNKEQINPLLDPEEVVEEKILEDP